MIKKKLFKKKNKKWKKIYFIIIFIIFLSTYFYYFKFNKKEYFIIPVYNKSFYYVPLDKGGQKIFNQDKKGLHLSYIDDNSFEIDKNNTIKYSIQVFTNTDYELVNNIRFKLLNKKDSIFIPEHFSTAIFENSLGKEYYLLYKNFETRSDAKEYCKKYVYFLDNCLVVNVQNLG